MNNKQFQQDLQEAWDRMPEIFSSFAFYGYLKKKGHKLTHGSSDDRVISFLKAECRRIDRMTWAKTYELPTDAVELVNKVSIEQAIEVLKSHGYKVLKPTYQEV